MYRKFIWEVCSKKEYFVNPSPAVFRKWTCPPSIFGAVHYHIWENQDKNLKLASQQYRAWSVCMDVQAGLALYWWQRLITLSTSRIRVKSNRRYKAQVNPTIIFNTPPFITHGS